MLATVDLWKQVVDDAALLHRANDIDPSDVAEVTALRRDYSADQVAVALELSRARQKAVLKFGERGETMVADVHGIEQATSWDVAACKAHRFIEVAEGDQMLDLCCGIGGDSLMPDASGLMHVVSVDKDAVRAWMTSKNTGKNTTAVCADVSSLKIDRLPVHIDPARRDERTARRMWRLEDCQPGPKVISNIIERSGRAAIKLSPGIDADTLPWPGDLQFISRRGRLVQAVLWTGGFVGDVPRQATLIDGCGEFHSLLGFPAEYLPLAPIDKYLYTIDPSVERANIIPYLIMQLDAPAIHPKLGLLTSDRIIDSPWVTGFEFIETLPWRFKKVKRWLKANDGGLVEVKTRGKACNPDIEQQRLRGEGATTYTVFVLRFDTKVEALITKRVVTK